MLQCFQNSEINTEFENKKHSLNKQLSSSADIKSIKKLKEYFDNSTPLAKTLSSIIDEPEIRSKWDKMGLDPNLVDKHFEDVQFLIKTRLVYSIVGMQETTSAGKTKHQIRETLQSEEKPELLILKEGN